MPAPTIAALPAAPSRNQTPDAFATTADTFVGALPAFREQINALSAYLDTVAAGSTDAGTFNSLVVNNFLTGGAARYIGGLATAVGGTANAITLTQTGVGLLIAGQHVRFAATSSNTGATTIDLDGSGAKSCTTPKGVALPSGYIRTDAYTDAIYNGSSFVVFRQAEDGSNANGDFWRMDSGLQICKQRFSNVTIAASTDNLITWTLPAAFKGTGYAISHTLLTAFPSTCPHPLTAWATSATLASIYVNRGASTSAFFDVTAVGTWY